MQNVLELMLYSLRLYGFWIIHPHSRCFILEKKSIIAAFGYAFGGATTILLIITENKLPLG
jgi:SSS family solute:Na+ symporter